MSDTLPVVATTASTPDLRTRSDRRPANRGARRYRWNRRLVLHPSLRFTQRLCVSVGCEERGGHFRIAPDRSDFVSKQLYFPETAILITRFMTPDGVGEVVDFMPVLDPKHASPNHLLVRLIRVVRGQMSFVLECGPRFDYGRAQHETKGVDDGVVFSCRETHLTLRATVNLQPSGDGARAAWTARSGEIAGAILESSADGGGSAPVNRERVLALFNRTVRFWRAWLDRSTYDGRWRETIRRSAMTLKLMTYAPTGALVAAPTTSLPKQLGGERNWDYRFTWVRDASFSVYALLGLGYTEEAEDFLKWLHARAGERAGERRRGRSRSCTGSTARPTFEKRRWTISRDIEVLVPSGSATAPRTSSSSTSSGRPWTPSTGEPNTASRSGTRGGRTSAPWSIGCARTGTGRTKVSGDARRERRTSLTAG